MNQFSPTRLLRNLVQRSPRLALAFRSYRDSRHLNRELVTTPLGFRFVGHDGMEQGTFEPDEVKLLSALLAQCDLFINIGANFGYYCCLAMSKKRDVIAFEPVPTNLQILYRNLRGNTTPGCQVLVHPVAVGPAPGLVDIFGGGTAASLLEGWAGIPSSYKQTVPLVTLDAALGNQVGNRRCLILMDVEGAELGVLQGARSLLDANPQHIWVIEITIDEHLPMGQRINPNLIATFDEFQSRGYVVWLVGKSLRPVQYAEVRAIATSGKNTMSGHNFVFAGPGTKLDQTLMGLVNQ